MSGAIAGAGTKKLFLGGAGGTAALVTNLRDDLTDVQRSVTSIRDDIAALTTTVHEGFRRMDQQFGEANDRAVSTERRLENVEASAREDHKQLWQSIRDKD